MSDKNENKDDKYVVKYSTSFKKDLKRIANQPQKVQKALAVVKILKEKGLEGIPAEMSPHYLKGQYKGYLECHIEGDFLIIWIQDDGEKLIYLMRLGTHSELFKK